MTATLTKRLTQLGLTDKESSVYMSLLQGGEMTADQLAKLSKLNRSTAYVQIKLLQDRGLVSTFKRGKKTYFAAESPNNLTRVIKKQKDELLHQESEVALLVPELLKIFGSGVDRPTVRVFEGKEGLVSMRNEILESDAKELRVALAYDSMSKIFSTDELLAFSKKRAEKKMHSKVLYTRDGEDMITVPPQQVCRVDATQFPFGSDVYIFGDTVSFASTKTQIVGVTIKNADVSKTVQTLFELAWMQGQNM